MPDKDDASIATKPKPVETVAISNGFVLTGEDGAEVGRIFLDESGAVQFEGNLAWGAAALRKALQGD